MSVRFDYCSSESRDPYSNRVTIKQQEATDVHGERLKHKDLSHSDMQLNSLAKSEVCTTAAAAVDYLL